MKLILPEIWKSGENEENQREKEKDVDLLANAVLSVRGNNVLYIDVIGNKFHFRRVVISLVQIYGIDKDYSKIYIRGYEI